MSTFGGVVPGWVYAECARPFTELLGLHGFQLMVSAVCMLSARVLLGLGGEGFGNICGLFYVIVHVCAVELHTYMCIHASCCVAL